MRILHVLATPRAEGTPRLALDWLSVAGHEQGVVFLAGRPPELLAEFQRSGCWLRVGDAIVPGPRKFARMVALVRRTVAEFRPDLVIAWPNGFSLWIFLGARLAGSSARLLSHGGNPPDPNSWFERHVMTCLTLWTATACRARLIACSRYVQRRFREMPLVPRATVGFAYNSVPGRTVAQRADAGRRERPATGPFRVIMVATLEPHKDHATLLHAARLLLDRGLEIEIRLAGAGSLEGQLRLLAKDLEIDGVIRFLGMRPDVPELLGQSDLFVLSTTPQEGRPGVILEALAAGLPILATDVEPVREVLEDGRWGTLVPPGDPDSLADAIVSAMQAGPLDRMVGVSRREHAACFTPERMIHDYLREAGD